MSNYPAGAERELARREQDELAYEQWQDMAYKSRAMDELAGILADAVTEALNYPEHTKLEVHRHALSRGVVPYIKKWLANEEWLYEWEAAHGIIQTFEAWREDWGKR